MSAHQSQAAPCAMALAVANTSAQRRASSAGSSGRGQKQLPMINDDRGEPVDRGSARATAGDPHASSATGFRYTFDVVNQKDINAFALPGGPMFLNRGMIEAAKTEAEVAGVMAHEIATSLLRHGTAQATKGQFQIGAIAGRSLARSSAARRQHHRAGLAVRPRRVLPEIQPRIRAQADILGAQIMARAGTTRGRWPTCSRRSRRRAARRPGVVEQPPEPGQPLRRHRQGSGDAAGRGRRQHRAVPSRSSRGWPACRPPHRRADCQGAGRIPHLADLVGAQSPTWNRPRTHCASAVGLPAHRRAGQRKDADRAPAWHSPSKPAVQRVLLASVRGVQVLGVAQGGGALAVATDTPEPSGRIRTRAEELGRETIQRRKRGSRRRSTTSRQ